MSDAASRQPPHPPAPRRLRPRRSRARSARAVWLQGVQAATLERIAARQQRADDRDARPAAGRSSTAPACSSRSASRRPRSTPTRAQVREPARGRARRARGRSASTRTSLYPQLADRTRSFVYVAAAGRPGEGGGAREAEARRARLLPEERRSYPQRRVAAQVLGYAGVDNNGLAGLERSLDRSSTGSPGSRRSSRDPFGRAIDVDQRRRPSRPGRDVFLTIDHTIQANAEAVLRETVEHWDAKAATRSCSTRAPAPCSRWRSRPATTRTASRPPPADRRATAPSPTPTSRARRSSSSRSRRRCPRSSSRRRRRSRSRTRSRSPTASSTTHEPRATEPMTVAQILSRSSNVGTITLAQQLGQSAPRSTGSSASASASRPASTSRARRPGSCCRSDWSGSTIGNVPIGQGIAVTPMQMASAYAAIANGGVWAQPHLVEHVGGRRAARHAKRRVISRTVAAQVMAMLPRRRRRGRHRHAGRRPGLQGRRQDGHRAKPDAAAATPTDVRRLVRRLRAGEKPAPRRPRLGRRAARSDLGRRRRRAGVRRDRAQQPASSSRSRPDATPERLDALR